MIFLYSIRYIKILSYQVQNCIILLVMMNPQFENQVGDEIQSIVEEISANERYLLVYFKPEEFQLSQYKQIKPYILVYNNDDERQINNLIADFAKQNNFEQFKHRISWVLYGGFELKPHMRIKDIKKSLRKDNINGLKVFGWINQQKFYDEECAVTVFIQNQQQFNDQAIEVPFHLPTTNTYILYIHIVPKKYVPQTAEVKQQLSTEIKRVFGVNTKPQNIQIILKTKQLPRVAQFKDLTNYTPSSAQQLKFTVQFKDKLILKQPARQNNSVIVIKGQGVNPTKHYYDDIKDKKVIDVLSNLNPHTNWNWHQYGLKICDVAIKPFQTFLKIQKFCKNSTQTIKHFSAVIIKEEHVFQIQFQKIKEKGEVDFQKQQLIIFDEKNQVHRKDCQARLKDRAQKTNHTWFKNNLKNVKPILLYTSELKVKGSQQSNESKPPHPSSIYRTMNTFLRNQQFCKVQQQDYEKWQFKFAIQLMNQLAKIPQTNADVLWRGVSYLPTHQIGDQVLFKQFNSSSTSETAARKFANKALYKITKAKSAHNIKQYSYYQNQDEVLFEPYVTLKIDKIQQALNNGSKIILYQAHQIEKKPLPDSKSLFILWVDDKTKEGKKMWQSLVEIQKTTIMIQLLTTQELQKWMTINKSIVEDQSVQLVLITNMKRIEAGKTVEKAGVYAIEVFKKFKPDSSIFVYIGWIEGAVVKLKQHNYILSDKLKVDNSQIRLREFLKTVGVK